MEKWIAAIFYEGRWKMYLEGLQNTLIIAVFACCIGIVLGLIVAVGKFYSAGSRNPVLMVVDKVCTLYTTVVRGTPVMVQLLILYSFAFMKDGIVVCILGFGFNSGAYVSEIIRAGIQSVDVGQMEAGRSLGLSRNRTMQYIILPQAVKNILPSLFNEFIALVKETSIAGYIAVRDLTKVASLIKSRTFNAYPLYFVALIYLVLVIGLTFVQKRLERRMARSDRS